MKNARLFLLVVRVRQLGVAGNGIGPLEPAPEINIAAALRTEGLICFGRGFLADRAFGRGFAGHDQEHPSEKQDFTQYRHSPRRGQNLRAA